MALEIYRKKRQFNVTPEPRGRKGRREGHRYVIQKHAARRLHYDLRLELDGVMKSWAVTRGPSLDPGEKRLAVHVEDHPVEYNTFEGTIPEGEYGGGTVMIWDRGWWIPEGDPHKAYAKGHLVFDLEGDKLRGRWHLVRMRRRERERHDNWLLIKGKDEEARGPRDKDILAEKPDSVTTGRSIEEIAAGKGKKRVWHSNRGDGSSTATAEKAGSRARGAASVPRHATAVTRAPAKSAARSDARQRLETPKGRRPRRATSGASLPAFVPFSLAALYTTAPNGPDWIHEIKFDGYRLEARLDHGNVQLLTRHQQDWTHRFEPVVRAVAALPAETALLDGEVIVDNERGISSFSQLQTDLKDGRTDRFIYYVFDLLHLDGRDLTTEPLLERKAALAQLLQRVDKDGPIRYTEHFEDGGPLVLKHACELGLEGIISKRRNAAYRSGRSENFVKTKCHGRQEFIVAGYTPSTAVPRAVGALTVAVHENGELRYAGRVGTGYTHKMAHELWKRLEPLRTDRRPIELPKDERRKDVVWVKPQLVVEAEFAEITHGGVLRQASFKGIREDKSAKEVVREVPARNPASRGERARSPTRAAAATRSAAPSTADARTARTKNKKGDSAGVEFHLTHPDRVYWKDVSVTKTDLAEYYVAVWDWMRPHLVERPLAIVRCPDGIDGECFFQKHIAANIKSSPLRHVVGAKEHDVIAVENLDDLLALVQSAALEIHVRGSRLGSLEMCDRIVFDLDPGDGVAWPEVVDAARETRDRLKAESLESFVKLSGGKGVHVVVPIAPADWDTVKTFTQRIAAGMAADSPKRYVAKMTKALRHGRIFIDYFRNSREATSIAAYSTRARAGAPVSMPVTWERLARTTGGNEFTVLDVKKRVKEDAWAEIGKVRQKLPEDLARRRLRRARSR